MVNGDTARAIANYQRSRKLNPDNFNAEDQVERMRYPERVPETPIENFAKVFTVKEYKADLDQLGNRLIEVHPNALKFIAEKDFWQLIEEKKNLITANTTYSEFAWHCSEIIASINCSHTSTGSFELENEICTAGQTICRLSNTKLQYYVANSTNETTATSLPDETGILPDHYVTQSIDDYFNKVDAVKEYTLHLLEK